jgi:hypothetical protein
MGTYSLDFFHTSLASNLCAKPELKNDESVESVFLQAVNRSADIFKYLFAIIKSENMYQTKQTSYSIAFIIK